MTKRIVRAVAVFSVVAVSLFLGLPAFAADLDIPIVVKWVHGVPYDLDGPVEVYKDLAWIKDKSGPDTKYLLIDREYQVLEEREELGRADGAGQDAETGEWFSQPGDGKMGTLSVSARLPESLQGKDAVVTLSSSRSEFGSIYLRRANGYEQSEIVPAGTYQVFEAKILGDTSQKYNPVYDGADIVIPENGYGHIEIEFQEGIGMAQSETDMEAQAGGKETTDKGNSAAMTSIIALFCMVGIIVAAGALFLIVSVKMNME